MVHQFTSPQVLPFLVKADPSRWAFPRRSVTRPPYVLHGPTGHSPPRPRDTKGTQTGRDFAIQGVFVVVVCTVRTFSVFTLTPIDLLVPKRWFDSPTPMQDLPSPTVRSFTAKQGIRDSSLPSNWDFSVVYYSFP